MKFAFAGGAGTAWPLQWIFPSCDKSSRRMAGISAVQVMAVMYRLWALLSAVVQGKEITMGAVCQFQRQRPKKPAHGSQLEGGACT